MKHRQNLMLLSISILLMLLLVVLSGSTRNGGAIVSPLDVQGKPTIPPPDWTITPVSNLPLTLYNYSPLPTPTTRPTLAAGMTR